MRYIFKTSLSMKPYNSKKWWIDNYVTDLYISKDTLKSAFDEYIQRLDNEFGITISKNAIRNKQPIFVDLVTGGAKQVGYVITGKTLFDDDGRDWKSEYIDIWTKILTVVDTEF